MMNVQKWLQNKSATFTVSYFKSDMLEVCLMKKTGDSYEVVQSESISISSEDNAIAENTSQFRNKVAAIKSKSPYWIHMVMRNVSFVKVFSLTNVSSESKEETISKRIRSEIPYLADEVVLHQFYQDTKEVGAVEVLVFGISKNVLSEQLKKLEAFGITPDRVVLSTEVLTWLYRKKVVPTEKPNYSSLLVHLFADQVELLFFEGENLLQSRWVAKTNEPAIGIREAVDASLAAFQREWRKKPNDALLLGISKAEAQTYLSDSSIEVKQITTGDSPTSTPLLFSGVIEGCQSEEISDFTLVHVKEVREKQGQIKELNRITVSIACFTLALLFFAGIQTLIGLMQIGWYQARMGLLSTSVSEVKKLRQDALGVLDHQSKKMSPVLLITSLRASIPDNVLLTDLDYDQRQKSISIKGIASQQPEVDQFLNALEKDPIFEHLNIEGVQAERGDGGDVGYRFSIKGSVKLGAGNAV